MAVPWYLASQPAAESGLGEAVFEKLSVAVVNIERKQL